MQEVEANGIRKLRRERKATDGYEAEDILRHASAVGLHRHTRACPDSTITALHHRCREAYAKAYVMCPGNGFGKKPKLLHDDRQLTPPGAPPSAVISSYLVGSCHRRAARLVSTILARMVPTSGNRDHEEAASIHDLQSQLVEEKSKRGEVEKQLNRKSDQLGWEKVRSGVLFDQNSEGEGQHLATKKQCRRYIDATESLLGEIANSPGGLPEADLAAAP